MGIIDKIKAVWDKVFKTNDVKKIFGIETGRSSDMDTALSKYKDMRSGIPYWCTGRIKPTRFSNVICREIANLTLFNADIQITGNDELQKRFDSVMNTLQEKQEESCATCGMMVKSNGDDVEFLDPDYFLITDTNTDGDALAAIFFSYLKKNDKYYTKAEYHRFEDVGLERVYHISSKAFKSDNKDMIGTEITLDRVDEWKDIEPEVYVYGLEYPLFVYWRNPYANAIDKESPLTVPAFSECIEELRWLDIALNMMGDETEDSRHITYVPQTAIEYASKYSIELPRFIQEKENVIMKAMLSQPMAGKTDQEIVETREKAIKVLEGKGYEIVNTLFTDEWYSNESMKERGVVQIPLCFLAKSLENMSLCHAAYFCKGWENARGCKIEHDAAVAYGLDIIYEE